MSLLQAVAVADQSLVEVEQVDTEKELLPTWLPQTY
jgi:hypothetical protein